MFVSVLFAHKCMTYCTKIEPEDNEHAQITYKRLKFRNESEQNLKNITIN